MRFDVRPTPPGQYRASDCFEMPGEPSSACRRSVRLAAKRSDDTRVDEDGAASGRLSVEAGAYRTSSGCKSIDKKRNVTCKSARVAQPAKKVKTVQGDEVGVNTRTKEQDRTQRVSRHLEYVETPKRGRNKMTLAETSPKREAMGTKSPATAKKQRARAQLAPTETSLQAKRIWRRSSLTSRSSKASQGVASSSGSYQTAKGIASDTASTTLEKEENVPPTPPVVEADAKLGRLRRVWLWLVENDGAQSGGRIEC
ncbi:hypothetical protein HPB52_023717 [Rhipicephalus sanguineus]|uniref:Uncharacterized protein n=1 Tax=Rhipicephalus sanguineus TaxID=34632 RepID=A0A9D4TC53_RHISA|nr:hypothetical protein HPB52_023717 [Rhipicephalus sanguineus]